MGTVADKLNKVQDTKDGLKAKLIAKGQPVSDSDTFASYIDKLGAIPTPADGSIPTKGASDLSASGKTVTVPAGYYASQVTKDVGTATQATPSISVSSAGLITASATQTAGYVSAGTKSATKQLTVQAAKTVTPGTADQTAVASGVYATGAVTVKGDADLVAANIVEGKEIFGVTGNAEPASNLASELSTQDTLIADIMTALEGKSAASGAKKTVSVSIIGNASFGAAGNIAYFDQNYEYHENIFLTSSRTIEAVGGVVRYVATANYSAIVAGEYVVGSNGLYCFLSDGGTITTEYTPTVGGGSGD